MTTKYYIESGSIIQEFQAGWDEATPQEKARWSTYNQQHVKRNKVMTLEEFEKEVRRQTIDRLYQSILAQGIEFPAQIREAFHEAMNKL